MAPWIRFSGIALLAAGLLYVGVRKAYVVHGTFRPSAAQIDSLGALGARAIPAGDVPVAALLLYNDSVIGQGYNTVLRDGNAGGHAEVNAVSDALHRLGHEGFAQLDRDHLLLVTTYEPCAMCRGMLLEYRIPRVAFVQAKTLRHWLHDDLRDLGQLLRQQRSAPAGLQDSLFRLYPSYDPSHAE